MRPLKISNPRVQTQAKANFTSTALTTLLVNLFLLLVLADVKGLTPIENEAPDILKLNSV